MTTTRRFGANITKVQAPCGHTTSPAMLAALGQCGMCHTRALAAGEAPQEGDPVALAAILDRAPWKAAAR